MLERLHEHGFDDLDTAHLNVFRYPGPQGTRPSELTARLRISKQALNYLLGAMTETGGISQGLAEECHDRRRFGDSRRVRGSHVGCHVPGSHPRLMWIRHGGWTAMIRASGRPTAATTVVTVAFLAGVGMRAWILSSPSLGFLDSDEAVWGLMARHLLHGEWHAFFWGQTYGGTQEVLVTAPLFALFGAGALALQLVPTILYAAASVLVWRVGRRTIGEPGARYAAALFWVWPSYFVWRSTKAYGFYGSVLVLGLAVLLLSLRLREKRSVTDVVLLGLAVGLGWWATPESVVVTLPALVWLAWRRPSLLRDGWILAVSALVGAAPWFVANARNGWFSLHNSPAATSLVGHARNLISATFPTALGLRVPFSLEWLPGSLVGYALLAIALGVLALLVVKRRGQIELLLFVCLVFPIFYILSPYSYLSSEPRYLTPLAPVIALLAARWIQSTRTAAVVLSGAFALSLAGLLVMDRDRLAISEVHGKQMPLTVQPVIDTLQRAGVRRAYADYWVAYLIDFVSGEQIIATPSSQEHFVRRGSSLVPTDTTNSRYPAWDRLVRSSSTAAEVFVSNDTTERRARRLLLNAGYRRVAAGGFSVYLPARPLGNAPPVASSLQSATGAGLTSLRSGCVSVSPTIRGLARGDGVPPGVPRPCQAVTLVKKKAPR